MQCSLDLLSLWRQERLVVPARNGLPSNESEADHATSGSQLM